MESLLLLFKLWLEYEGLCEKVSYYGHNHTNKVKTEFKKLSYLKKIRHLILTLGNAHYAQVSLIL